MIFLCAAKRARAHFKRRRNDIAAHRKNFLSDEAHREAQRDGVVTYAEPSIAGATTSRLIERIFCQARRTEKRSATA